VGALRRAVGRSDRPLAAHPHGGALLGLCGHRPLDRHAGPGAGRDPARRRPTSSSCAGAPECFGRPGGPPARRAGRDRAQRRQRHPPRSRRARARDDGDWVIDGQKVFIGKRRDRRRPRRRRHRGPRGRPPRTGRLHRPEGHPGTDPAAQARQARMPRLPHRRDRLRGLPRARRPPPRRRRAPRRAHREGPRGRAGRAATGAGPPTRAAPRPPCNGGSSAALGAFERTRPMVAAQAIGIARAALEFARGLRRLARGLRPADHREPGHLVSRSPTSPPTIDARAAADLARGLDGRTAQALRARRGLHVQAEGLRGRGARLRAGGSRPWAAWGYIKDFPVEKWYRDAKLYTIFEGTSEIQRLVIGRALRAEANTEPLDRRMEVPR